MQEAITGRLVDDWRRIAAKAWSIRLALGAAALSSLDVFAQAVLPSHPGPWLAGGAALLGLAAAVARIVSQPRMTDGSA